METIQVKLLSNEARLPTRGHPTDAGLDLYALEWTQYGPNQVVAIKTGIAINIPPGHVGLICDRSSLGKKGMKVMGGVVDAGYQGEVIVCLNNLTNNHGSFNPGDRVAQLVILPIVTPTPARVQSFDEPTSRGEKGFGSTGV